MTSREPGPGLRLRIGAPPLLWERDPKTGTGRVWLSTLPALAPMVDLIQVPAGPRVDVDGWIWDGHGGAIDVRQPVVVEVHEARWVEPEYREGIDPGFLEQIERSTKAGVLGAAVVVTPSEAARQQIMKGYGVPGDRVLVAPFGVDHDMFRPAPDARVVAASLGVPFPYVLSVATAFPPKNLPMLTEAMASVRRAGFPHRLVLVTGASPDRDDSTDLLRGIDSDETVLRLGRVTDVELAALMAEADVFCLPATFEGFGIPVLEAMACATVVVASRRGAFPEIVGDAGVLFDLGVDDLGAVLSNVLGDTPRRDVLGAAARERSMAYTWERTAEGWLSALRQAVAAG